MSTAKIVYRGTLRTEATHLQSNTNILTDAPTDNKGKGESFSPTDLVATALGSCILTIMGIKAQGHKLDMSGATAEVTKVMASGPRRISQIQVKIQMPPNNWTDKQKQILLAAARHCPVSRSLHPDLAEVVEINF